MLSQGAFIRIAIGFIYPAYKSLEAMMTEDCEDDMVMLRYWVVLAALSLVETIADPLFDFLPGYLLGKCLFLLWCMLPGDKNGADIIFSKVSFISLLGFNIFFLQILFPLFKEYHQDLGQHISATQNYIRDRFV